MAGSKRGAGSGEGEGGGKKQRFSTRTRTPNPEIQHTYSTRLATTAASRNAVLHTQELLVSILAHLPPASLLTTRLVSQTFKTLIDTHPTLQRALFLAPPPALQTPHQWLLDTKTKLIKLHEDGEEYVKSKEWEDRQGAVTLAVPNHMLFKREGSAVLALEKRFELCETLRFVDRPSMHGLPDMNAVQLFDGECDDGDGSDADEKVVADFHTYLERLGAGIDIHGREDKQAKERRVKSLVHDMHVCYPPVKDVEIYYSYYATKPYRQPITSAASGHSNRLNAIRVQVSDPGGVKVGQLLRAFTRRLAKDGFDGKKAWLKVGKCAVWMKGVLFATEEEIALVEREDGVGSGHECLQGGSVEGSKLRGGKEGAEGGRGVEGVEVGAETLGARRRATTRRSRR